jgi:GAF domain-containing protein
VFDLILEKALALSGSSFGALSDYRDGQFWTLADRGVVPELSAFGYRGVRPEPGTLMQRMIDGEDVATLSDITATPEYRAGVVSRVMIADIGGARSQLMVAIRKDRVLRGILNIYRREARPFADGDIAIAQALAAQAAIAMENARTR